MSHDDHTPGARLIADVLAHLGARQLPAAFDAPFGERVPDGEELALVLTVSGGAAMRCDAPPADWKNGLDGALFIRTGQSWRAVSRHEGAEQAFPGAETDVPASGDMVFLRFEDERDSAEALYLSFAGRARKLA